MSRDLQSRRPLSEIQLPNIINSSSSSNILRDEPERCSNKEQAAEIRTPGTPQNLIPKILSCPPAPKKPKRVISCKRKLLGELEFFDVAAKEEVDSFFKSVDENSKPCGANSNKKRRCLL
ncbi:putative non-symbiotic hemoglobin 2-like [Capsicum annuum]|uniref:Cyclin-dependent protein kinase inhibitor SMR1-like n=1 Tax=Capsicum annuum TaxID=4072 RepID=A0A1U8G9F4_CAPAN|nr:uncharacterized protein LOC107863745 [Capsicum annuum]KAF3666895.1 putative non-symbiotic hemoglobin 2-like [Capsicum annuum]KAF3679074.1 putative non-symbiotic hemoglobin 2-like [Capsicum annuum]PHT86938.1 hypothetical protein T459_09044 [Capsicum annuum]